MDSSARSKNQRKRLQGGCCPPEYMRLLRATVRAEHSMLRAVAKCPTVGEAALRKSDLCKELLKKTSRVTGNSASFCQDPLKTHDIESYISDLKFVAFEPLDHVMAEIQRVSNTVNSVTVNQLGKNQYKSSNTRDDARVNTCCGLGRCNK
ncbi:unnamed protein product [Chrysodeixis includens]|uniref:Uncharacterized protein n=1 Tax=Chrysodeixis includens TaxID=689277 RepID=A0A9P0BKJ1_CHRIL|nr:unnamed protein product [Chrysodeixis includens]